MEKLEFSLLWDFIYIRICIFLLIGFINEKVTLRFLKHILHTYFSPKFNIKIFSIKHFSHFTLSLRGKILVSTLIPRHVNMISTLFGRYRHYSGLMCAQTHFPVSFSFFPGSCTTACWQALNWYLRKKFLLWFPFSVLWPEIS